MGQQERKHQMWSLQRCHGLVDGKALMQVAEEQVLGALCPFSHGLWLPGPDPLSWGRGFVHPAVCKQLKKVIFLPNSSFLAQLILKICLFYQHLRRMLSRLCQKLAL